MEGIQQRWGEHSRTLEGGKTPSLPQHLQWGNANSHASSTNCLQLKHISMVGAVSSVLPFEGHPGSSWATQWDTVAMTGDLVWRE